MSIMKPPFHTELNLGHRLSQGIVGCWLFNEAPPPLGSALDLSGNGNHGTLVGDTRSAPGKFGPALEFDGAGDYVDTSFNGTEDDEITIVVWFKTDTIAAGIAFLVDNSPGAVGYAIRRSGNELQAFVYNGGSTSIITIGPIITDRWYQVVLRKSVTHYTLYLDGLFQGDRSQNPSIDDSAETMNIGGEYNGNTVWSGQISDVTIWNRALSAGEISDLYRDPFQMFKRNL